MTNYQKGFYSTNIRRTLLGIRKGTKDYNEIMEGYQDGKRQRNATFEQRITDEAIQEIER